ncbi:MAG: hypothetical protein O3A06_10870 [Proteobacteria bacterium]|nr:hypothetical protein [Pseudomonadota bacterium]
MAIYGIPQDYLGLPMMEDWIRRAQAGDVQAARAILDDFVGAVRQNTDRRGGPHRKPSGIGTQIDERAIRYLAECFKKILDGVSADKALGVKPGESGRPKMSGKRARDLDVATEVAGLIRSGKKPTIAYQTVAERRHLENSGVRKIFNAHKEIATIVAAVLARLRGKNLRV